MHCFYQRASLFVIVLIKHPQGGVPVEATQSIITVEGDKYEQAPGQFTSLRTISFSVCRTSVCMDKRHSGSPSIRV